MNSASEATTVKTHIAYFQLMPGFHHSVAVLPLQFRRAVLPFRCAVVTFRCTVAVLPFRIATVAVAGENRNAGNVFPYTPG